MPPAEQLAMQNLKAMAVSQQPWFNVLRPHSPDACAAFADSDSGDEAGAAALPDFPAQCTLKVDGVLSYDLGRALC